LVFLPDYHINTSKSNYNNEASVQQRKIIKTIVLLVFLKVTSSLMTALELIQKLLMIRSKTSFLGSSRGGTSLNVLVANIPFSSNNETFQNVKTVILRTLDCYLESICDDMLGEEKYGNSLSESTRESVYVPEQQSCGSQ
jgi:hypothetical protein